MNISTRPKTTRTSWLIRLPVATVTVIALSLTGRASGEATFKTWLDTNLKLTNHVDRSIGFLGSFPKPDDDKKNPDTHTQKKSGRYEESPLSEAWGESSRLTPTNRQWYNAQFMRLRVEGQTWADGELAMWGRGRQRITLHNKTGDEGGYFGEGKEVDFNLHLEANAMLWAIAKQDAEIDRATSKVFFRIYDVASSEELTIDGKGVLEPLKEVLKMPADVVDPHQIANDGETKKEDGRSTSYFTLPVPANTKKQLDIEAYVFGSAISFKPPAEDESKEQKEAREKQIADFIARSNLEYPDPDMKIEFDDLLPGDSSNQGSWRTDSVTGLVANDPLSHYGLDTLFLSHTAVSPAGPHDVELTLEVPVDGVKQVAIENHLTAPGGRFGHAYRLSIGTGVDDGFEESGDTTLLALLGGGSELPPETIHDDPDYPQPRDYWYTGGSFAEPLLTSLAGAFELSPGDEAAGLFVVQITDAADGVIDGLARFTLRQVLPGIAGDYNYDGVVNTADYTVWRDNLGATSIGLAADGNGNRTVDMLDYQVWRMNFGNPAALSASHTAVPEPSAWASLALLALTTAHGYRAMRV